MNVLLTAIKRSVLIIKQSQRSTHAWQRQLITYRSVVTFALRKAPGSINEIELLLSLLFDF